MKINEKQKKFFLAKNRYIAYGGARGGGKSWAVRMKSIFLANRYDGIKILIIRRSFAELRENHILELNRMLNRIAIYKDSTKKITFPNGSTIQFGYCDSEQDVLRYQGMEFDIIFIDEATQLTEYQFETLNASIRGVNDFPKRMYLTCNPGGVGHTWVKRLFIERKYREGENPDDFFFVAANVFDNDALLKKDNDYVKTLEKLPLEIKRAWLYGDWDVLAGQFFSEFDTSIHIVKPFDIIEPFRLYATMDYGLDMLAHYLIAVTESGNIYVIDELYESNLIISDASKKITDRTNEDIFVRIAPPDLWGRSQESGKSRADIFAENGLFLTKCSNDVEAGLAAVKELMRVNDNKSKLKIFSSCTNLIHSIKNILSDDTNPNRTANNPHILTHAVDSLRYFASFYYYPPRKNNFFDISILRKDILEDYIRGDALEKKAIENRYTI